MRATRATLLVIVAVLCSCVHDEPPEGPAVSDDALIEPSDDTAPIELLALAGEDQPARDVPTYDQMLAGLDSDPELAELRVALAAAGWTAPEAAGIAATAAGYNSGAEHDDVRARRADVRQQIATAFAEFERDLVEAEQAHGVTVDRDELFAALFSAEVVR
jgi:hypothetical protein